MSILIKGMEMPDIENNKSIKAEIRNLDGKLELGIMTGGYYCSQQWTYYPIVSVPTPHGRLIDADALLSVAEPIEDRRGNVKRVVWDAHINRRPTVIEAEAD